MHPARARETTLAGRPEARCGVADIDRLVGNGVWVCNDATPLTFNDVGHSFCFQSGLLRGITIDTSATDLRPIKAMRLQTWHGKTRVRFGGLIEGASV
jgi:hypothetical protein